MKILKIFSIGLLALIGILLAGFVIWALTPLGPMPEALAALESGDGVVVTTTDWIEFRPEQFDPDTGVIIYPGGRVDPRSYAPLARLIAIHGYRAVIVPMPLNLAVFAPGKAQEVIQSYPMVKSWSVGGHSLGGAMAANYAFENPATIKGVFLMAAYPADKNDLSQSGLLISSIYGTMDGVAPVETILAAEALLPLHTEWISIEGGNHSQFGWYGDQPGDLPAEITREEQQSRILEAILKQLQMFGGEPESQTGTGSLLQNATWELLSIPVSLKSGSDFETH